MNKGRFNKLLEKAKCGDNHAIELLYKRLSLAIFTTSLIYVKNKEDAEDISEEVFWKIITYDGNPIQEPVAWIKKIIRNDCLNYIKKQNRITATECMDDFISCDSNSDAVGYLTMKDYLNVLDETERNIVINHVFWRYTLFDISKKSGIPYITVKRKYKKIKEKLNEFLKT